MIYFCRREKWIAVVLTDPEAIETVLSERSEAEERRLGRLCGPVWEFGPEVEWKTRMQVVGKQSAGWHPLFGLKRFFSILKI